MTETFGCRKYKDKVGILVAQLGTPDEPTTKALKRYLKEFLSDRRVIEVPRVLWWFILNFIILQTRPKKSAANYKKVWTSQGSPLLTITKSQSKKLKERLSARFKDVAVEFGMRYGNPSIESAVESLMQQGCNKLLLLPMYPQYAAPTSASVYDAFFPAVLKRRWVPTVKVVEPFFRNAKYIEAVSSAIKSALKGKDLSTTKVMLSYHGMPKSYVDKGDSYCCMCFETSRLICAQLGVSREAVLHTYQSRFGKEPWLEPYTDETFEKLGKSGVKDLVVACPGFVADCLETIDEIGNEGLHQFKETGGESLTLVPCVNDSELFIDCLEQVVVETAGNWFINTDVAKVTCDFNKPCNCDCPAGCNTNAA